MEIKTTEASLDKAVLSLSRLEEDTRYAKKTIKALAQIVNNPEENREAVKKMFQDPSILNDVRMVTERPLYQASKLQDFFTNFFKDVRAEIVNLFKEKE